MRKREAAVVASVAVAMMGSSACLGQRGTIPDMTRDPSVRQPEQTIQQQRDMPMGEIPRYGEHVEAYRLAAALKEKQKKFRADSQKMVALATEVNQAAAKPGDDKAVAEMAKKTAQIEKLAHSVAARLKDDH